MGKLLGIEFRKLSKSRTFWISIAVGCVLALMHTLWAYKSVYEVNNNILNNIIERGESAYWFETGILQGWIGTEGFSVYNQMLYMLFPLLSVMPYGLSLAREWNTGYSLQILTRCNRRDYFTAKYIVTFVSGGIAVTLPLVLSLLMAACYLPAIAIDPMAMHGMMGENMWIKLYMETPVLYALGYCVIDFIYGGICSILTAVVSAWCSNLFLAFVFPMVTNIFTTMGIGSLIERYRCRIPGEYINPIQHGDGYDFGWIILVTLILLFICTGLYILNNRKSEMLE